MRAERDANVKSKIGVICIILGTLLLLGSSFLVLFNMHQDAEAGNAAADVLPQLVEQIRENTVKEPTVPEKEGELDLDLQIPVDLLTEEDKKMTEIEIDGYAYIGYLSIPALDLELPIMSDWSYPQLKIAPCRYNGSVRGEDLVLMAHNYKSHFGRLSQLNIGDSISFTDMDGVTTSYKVVAKDILEPTAVEEITDGAFDLTLFTCTYGGATRVTVYCDKIS